MNKNDKYLWSKEYNEFAALPVDSETIPNGLFESIKNRIFPNPWKVFGKVAFLHVVVGFLSLGVCNQFGLNPFQTTYSLSDFFMKSGGHNFCMFACGVFFVATTYLLANLFLTLEEVEAIRKYEWLQSGILALVSIAGFYFLGAELVGTFVALWIGGALFGGLLTIEGSFRLRRQFA